MFFWTKIDFGDKYFVRWKCSLVVLQRVEVADQHADYSLMTACKRMIKVSEGEKESKGSCSVALGAASE